MGLVRSSRIPTTPSSRLCAPDAQQPAAALSAFPTSPSPSPIVPAPPSDHDGAAAAAETVLYLAYGSNMCAQTFLGKRGIRPLSALNVSAPSLRLTFDLPILPYAEPCTSNVAPRRLPKPQEQQSEPASDRGRAPTWTRGLVGVVYEVTRADYATIIATEGGGASYTEILAPCIALAPPARAGAGHGSNPFPCRRPFLARTLYAPRPRPGDDDDDDRRLRLPLLPPCRPDPDQAQPSARYLALLVAGAAEHGLPAEYQAYLRALRPYTITSRRQELGRVVFAGFWRAVLVPLLVVGPWCADKRTGRVPPWFAAVLVVVLHLIWMSYDAMAKPVFGDGETTVGEGEGARGVNWARGRVLDEEKGALLGDMA